MPRLLILLALLFAAAVGAQNGATLVQLDQLQEAIKEASTTLAADDPRRESLLKSYAETRAALLAIKNNRSNLETYTLARAHAAVEAEGIEASLAEQQRAPRASELPLRGSLIELEQQIQLDKAELAALRGRLADISLELEKLSGRPAAIRARLTELLTRQAELESQLALMNQTAQSGAEGEAALWLAQAKLARAQTERAMLDAELLSQPMRRDLLKAQQDKANFEVSGLENRLQALEKRAGELRQGEAKEALEQAEQALAGTQGKHELVQQLADENANLSAAFGERNTAIAQTRERESTTRKRAEQLEDDLRDIERRLKIIGMTSGVGAILREQSLQLPTRQESARWIAAIESSLAQTSMRQVELEDQRRQLRDLTVYVEQLLAGRDEVIRARIKDDLLELARKRQVLLRTAADLENTYALGLQDLDFTLRRYAQAVNHYRDFISERMLWIPTRDTFAIFHGASLLRQVAELFAPQRWIALGRSLPRDISLRPLAVAALLLVVPLIYFGPALRRKLETTGKSVSYVQTDLYTNTLLGLGLTLLLSLRWPLLLITAALLLEPLADDSDLALAAYEAALRLSPYLWGLEIQRLLLLPQGLAAAHFLWSARRTASLYRRLLRLEQTFLPAAFAVMFLMALYPREVGGPLGALAVVAVLLSIAHFFHHIPYFVQSRMDMSLIDSEPKNRAGWGRWIRLLLIWAPVAGIVGVVMGYTYTAIEFTLLLVQTLVLYCSVLLVYELGLRWLRLTRRRMVVKEREEQAGEAVQDSEITPAEEKLESDHELLSDEGAKLLSALLVVAGVFGILLIWSRVFPALGVLDAVELWHRTGVVDGFEAIVPVTLGDVLTAVIVAVIGWVALSRIPSLLEILLRRRMNVQPASAYAVTRVFQYGATTLMVILVVSILGGSWSQIQWAVAALSLGIGFGLQEIVANFISGLIILFEQPIRLGDTVTVGDVSGKVTRIRIRATTIRDFDRRELLVPNKEFVTNRLLNWSLSDQVTRSRVDVGVAYGTDMAKAMAVVRQVAQRHPLVLRDPEPSVRFEDFGDSSLLISLRYFMGDLDNRLRVASDLRFEINRRFKEEGIAIAFPQRDVHLDTSEPLEIKWAGRAPESSGSGGDSPRG